MTLGKTLLVASMAVTVLAFAQRAEACTCAPLAGLADAASKADVVLQGTPTATGGHYTDATAGRMNEYEFAVTRIWKGNVYATQSIWAAEDSAACGLTFGAGPWVVFAASTDARLITTSCSGNMMTTASTDLSALGTSSAPLAGRSRTPLPTGGCNVAGGRPAGGWLLVALVFAFRVRRRR